MIFEFTRSLRMIVGINGFGRIGKQVYRILVKNGVKVALVNDPNIDLKYFYYLAKYDTVYGTIEEIDIGAKSITAHGIETFLSNETDPRDIKWSRYDVDYVLECSGKFTTLKKCERHKVGRVILSSPSEDVPMFVYGVNHTKLGDQKVISTASCTTNCLAPLAKLLNDNFGIVEGFLTTVHAMTGSQKPVDLKGAKYRLSRSCMNIIPSTTGAATAVEKVIPELAGKMDALAFRVPIIDVSVIDFVVKLNKPTNLKEIRKLIEKPKESYMQSIIGLADDDVVSSDMIGDSHSSIVDFGSCMQLSPTFFKLISWYDNEYGYCCRMVDMLFYIAEQENKLSIKR